MATEILAVGTSAANSSEVTVAAGAPVTVSLKDVAGVGAVPPSALMTINLKDDDGAFFEVGRLTAQIPATVLVGPGVYRLSRPAGNSACGAFSA
jgi:hypothetical protein